MATPAIADGVLYIRGLKHVIAIGPGAPKPVAGPVAPKPVVGSPAKADR